MTLLLLWVNVVYTLFQTGIYTAFRYRRIGYLLLVTLFGVGAWVWSVRKSRSFQQSPALIRFFRWFTCVWGITFVLQLSCHCTTSVWQKSRMEIPPRSAQTLPNIIIFAADGLSAKYLSAYGRERDTTPFLREWSADSVLFCENAFPNAVNSGASIASMLSGKWSTTLRLYYPPEILTGQNAYNHLPGILKRLGYYNVDISSRKFADSYDLNFINAFDESNGQYETWRNLFGLDKVGLDMYTLYFLNSTCSRIFGPVLHLLNIKNWESAYAVVAGNDAAALAAATDVGRLARLKSLINDNSKYPFFAHIHLMGTHGPSFLPTHKRFSENKTQRPPYDIDYYDDALLDMDAFFSETIDTLKQAGILDNTIIIVSSDHGQNWQYERVPLIFRFPDGQYARRLQHNVCNVDIAPTLLNYLGIQPPDWMVGTSVLLQEPEALRPLFWSEIKFEKVDMENWILDRQKRQAPFYSLSVLGVSLAQEKYRLDLESGRLLQEQEAEHTSPVPIEDLPPPSIVRSILQEHLRDNAYRIPDYLSESERSE